MTVLLQAGDRIEFDVIEGDDMNEDGISSGGQRVRAFATVNEVLGSALCQIFINDDPRRIQLIGRDVSKNTFPVSNVTVC